MKIKTPRPTQIALLCASLFATSHAIGGTVLTLAQQPLYGTIDLAPNLSVTLDDSGSMAWAYMPDTLTFGTTSRRFRAASANPLAYNPNTVYYAPKKADGSTYTTTFTHAYINGFNTSAGWVDLSVGYKTTTTYTPGGSNTTANHPTDPTFATSSPHYVNASSGAAAYYYVRDNTPSSFPSPSGCPSATADDDRCFVRVDVSSTSGPPSSPLTPGIGPDERQNFANWYSFYRTRNLLLVSGASRAFYDLSPSIRVNWQAINTCQGFGGSCSGYTGGAIDNKLRTFTDAADGNQKSNFYTWLSRLPAAGGTPLRKAYAKVGALYKTTGANSPYGEYPNRTLPPGVSSSTEYSCRPNYALVMTDGLWNSDSNSDTGLFSSEFDDVGRTLPQPYSPPVSAPWIVNPNPAYAAIPPYSGVTDYTLADMAFNYWATDLRPGTALADRNNVPPFYADKAGTPVQNFWNAKNDPATWQHVVTFTMGLGLTKTLQSTGLTWGGDTYTGSYPALVSGATAWPAPADNNANNVSDLWHAAVNSRGQFFSIDDPDSLVNAFTAILARVQAGLGSGSALAASTTSLAASASIYQATYNGQGWSGDLKKIPLTSSGAMGTPTWSAADMLNPGTNPSFNPNNRVVLSATGGANSTGIAFRWADLSSGQQTLLQGTDTVARAQERLDWLRGNASKEGSTAAHLRQRATTKLGDIIDSSPQYVGAPQSNVLDASYSAFVLANCPTTTGTVCTGSRDPVIYVGANDGMVHGFKDSSGEEVLAFVPSEVYANLRDLSSPGYTHKMFVDGTPRASDAFLAGAWRSLLIGGLGAGGKGVYALNVTDPSTFSEANANAGAANRLVQWELTSSDPDAGHIYGQPRVVKLQDNKWYAMFGNGYNSTNGSSTLFLVDLDTAATSAGGLGSNYKKLTAPAGSGLATVLPVDLDNDGKIDYAYAGDIDGNLWRFNLDDSAPSNWKVDTAPIFVAKDNANVRQPITTMPQALRHPYGGTFIVFGTGSSLQASDVSSTQLQRLYGIWNTSDLTPAPSWPDPTYTLSQLEQRTFVAGPSGFRTVSGAAMNWYSPSNTAGKLGWYVDFDALERIGGDPEIRSNRIYVVTNVPNATDPCSASAISWLTIIDPITGLPPNASVFDTNGDGLLDNLGYSMKTNGASMGVPLPLSTPESFDNNDTSDAACLRPGFASKSTGGIDSTQINGCKGRIRQGWRQLSE